jgi:hypothetical protein
MKKTYITQEELNKLKDVLLVNKQFKVLIAIICLTELNMKFRDLERIKCDKLYLMLDANNLKDVKEEIISLQNKLKNKSDMAIQITLHHFNRLIKQYGHFGNILFTTKIFYNRLNLDGKIVYGYIEHNKAKKYTLEKVDNYIYIFKQTHRNEVVNNLLTDKKIGITNDVKYRKNSLTLGPVGIKCLALWKVEISFVGKLEKILQKTFLDRKIIGEWFTDEDNDLVDLVRKELLKFTILDIDIKECPINNPPIFT